MFRIIDGWDSYNGGLESIVFHHYTAYRFSVNPEVKPAGSQCVPTSSDRKGYYRGTGSTQDGSSGRVKCVIVISSSDQGLSGQIR